MDIERLTVLDNEYATLWYYPASGIVHHQFHCQTSGLKFRDVLTNGLNLMRKQGAKKWLSDDRENSRLAMEDAEWVEDIWQPQANATGWKHWGIILPSERLGQINLKRIVSQVAVHNITCEIFSDPELALKWLKAQ